MRDRRHEVAADVAADDVQAIDRQCERQEEEQQADGLAAYLGSEQVGYGADKPAKGLEIERRGLFAHADSWAGAKAGKVIANLPVKPARRKPVNTGTHRRMMSQSKPVR